MMNGIFNETSATTNKKKRKTASLSAQKFGCRFSKMKRNMNRKNAMKKKYIYFQGIFNFCGKGNV